MKKILLSILLFSSFLLDAQNVWTKRESVGDSKRERGVGFSIAGKGYVALGQDTLNLMLNDLWEYDPATNSWTQRANFPGTARRDAAAFSVGNKAYVGTGMSNADATLGTILSDFWEYNPGTNSWTGKAMYPGNFGAGIYYATGFAIGSKGYFCCGKEGPGTYSNDLWEYNPATDIWTMKASFPGNVRYGSVAFTIGTNGYVGTGTDDNVFTQDFYKYNSLTNTWSAIAMFPGSPRFSCSGFTLQNQGYIVFGSDGGYKDELWMYDPISDYWTTKASYPNGERRSAFTFVIGNSAYAGTGKGLTGVHRDMYMYSPAIPAGINESEEAIITSMFPNPMSDHLTIQLPEQVLQHYSSLHYEIRDALGKSVYIDRIENSTIQVNRNSMSAGIYFIRILNEYQPLESKQFIVNP